MGKGSLCTHILGLRIDLLQIPDVINIMEDWIKDKIDGNYVVIANADTAVLSKKNIEIKNAVNNSTLSVPDGISLVALARLKGFTLRKRAYGPDLMFDFLNVSQSKGYSHFFYGSTPDTLKKLEVNLINNFPNLKIAGFYSPPFRDLAKEEEDEIINIINNASADVLWVGLGCPRQELWMRRYINRLKVPVVVGTGAAFDFLAGTKPQAPCWMRDYGFEWLFRLITEPKRLWRRYLINGSLFIYYVGIELISKKFSVRFRKKNN